MATRRHGRAVKGNFRLLPLAFCLLPFLSIPARAGTYYVTVSGLGGEPDYAQRFAMWSGEIDKILKSGGADAHVETLQSATRERVRAVLEKVAREAAPQDALVLMLIGHGGFDGFDYKINLPGPDLSASELASLLDRIRAGRQLVVNMTSASGGAIDTLRKPHRVIISATKTGTEKNATVFARYWVEALRDPAADTDKNETISAMEAFRYAQQKTANFYETQKRLATEHAVLDDTGKGETLLASTFPLVRFGAAAKSASDPVKRKLFAKKEELENRIDQLKYQKAALPANQYKAQLTALLLELAKTQEELDK